MATVQMDSSEYELMKENKELLEQALKREKSLSEEIDRLNKEKIKVLEESSKKISIIRKNKNEEYVMITNNSYNNLENFYDLIRNAGNRNSLQPCKFDFDYMIKNLFTRTKTVDAEQISYEIVGLDEARTEIEKKLREDLDKEVKYKLDRLGVLEVDYKSAVCSRTEAFKQITSLTNHINLVEASNKDLNNMLALNLEEKFCRANIIQEIKQRTLFNPRKVLNRIESIVFTQKETK